MIVDVTPKTETLQNTAVSARTIWGRAVVYLREHGAVALHIACGDISDVDFVGNKLEIRTTEDFLYELLKNKDNQNDLTVALSKCGVSDFEVIKKEKILTKSQRDLAKLKEIFGNNIIIEED